MDHKINPEGSEQNALDPDRKAGEEWELEMIKKILDRRKSMTYHEILHQGRLEGRLEGKLSVALKLLKEGMSMEQVEKLTELSRDFLDNLFGSRS